MSEDVETEIVEQEQEENKKSNFGLNQTSKSTRFPRNLRLHHIGLRYQSLKI